ncbi:MAG: M6 family metalloprotease domain-containing protein [Verrucomicrobiota bacterium]
MKKSKILKPVSLFVFLAGLSGFVNAAPYGPGGLETQWVQPGGETLTLRVYGDDYYARTETPAGYTVVLNRADNAYHYAELSADGTSLVPSAVLANEAAPVGIAPHIELPKAKILEIVQKNRVTYDGDRALRWDARVQAVRQLRDAANGPAPLGAADKIQAAPVTGSKLGLTILVQFPDDTRTSGADPVNFPTSRSKITQYCNEVGYTDDGNTGSVRDYFFDQSLGKLTYTQNVTQIITVPRARNYYNYSDYPANKTLRGDASRLLVTDAIGVLQTGGFDFTGLTVDASNRAVATNLFFAGPTSGVWSEGLWPSAWSLAAPMSVGTASKPVYISAYQITNIQNDSPVIGTFCHENGHLLLGYPDIYSNAPDGEGVGEHCLMGSGNHLNGGRTPSPINAYFKDIVGWANITDMTPAEFKTAKLPTTGNVAYRLRNPTLSTESFFVENRGEGDDWAEYSDDQGIVIWHIDEAVSGNLSGAAHYGVAVEQADGRQDLENNLNRGDSTDYFDLSTPKFDDTTSPNARWWSGARSGVKVQVLTDVAASTTVLFGGVPPNTIFLGKPNGGEVVFPDSSLDITWQANVSGNVKIDLYKGGVFNSVIAADQPNDGIYTWKVPASLPSGKNYSIRIITLSNPVPSSDSSDATFEINDASFPPGGVMPYGWFKPSGAAKTWEVTKSTTFEGSAALVSKNPGDGETSAVAYSTNFKAGNVSFYYKVSSEKSYDLAKFYIDGVAQSLPSAGSRPGISGQVGWIYATFPVSSGKHTLKWSYEKDDSYAGGKDSAWLDGVSLPETTQEISVMNSKGTEFVNDKSTVTFPDVTLESSSSPKTYTIKNVGKSALLNLKVSATGANPDQFKVQSLKKSVLDPGESTTFEVKFSPTQVGLLAAVIRIRSNDSSEDPFDFNVEGTGMGLPKIGVYKPDGSKLKDGDANIGFDFATVGTDGKTKTITIKNLGSAKLNDLKVSKTSGDKKDFEIGPLGRTSLGPGASTTFKVTFHPTARDKRKVEVQILSNDKKSGPFDMTFTGTGAPKSSATSAQASPLAAAFASPGSSDASQLPQVTTVEVIQGQKYLALSVTKQAGVTAGDIEVSPNLLDWFSGKKHTTVLIDDATTLKVRDNTPVTRDVKRYIRLK